MAHVRVGSFASILVSPQHVRSARNLGHGGTPGRGPLTDPGPCFLSGTLPGFVLKFGFCLGLGLENFVLEASLRRSDRAA
jgi:hypothetical protein